MKRIIFPLLLSCIFQDVSAQFYSTISISKSACKLTRVKTLKIYGFQSETDSVLAKINTYDTSGNTLSSRTFSKKGMLTGVDTFIYDQNHYLIKHISSDGGKRVAASFITNNANGKELKSEIFMNDSLVFRSNIEYDNKDCLVRNVTRNYKADSTIVRSYYNEEGLKIKTISFDKKPDSTITIYEYDPSGKILRKYKNDFESKSSSVYSYDLKGNCTEITTTLISGNERSINTEKFSYYANGLTFENLQSKNNRSTGKFKAFYIYY